MAVAVAVAVASPVTELELEPEVTTTLLGSVGVSKSERSNFLFLGSLLKDSVEEERDLLVPDSGLSLSEDSC